MQTVQMANLRTENGVAMTLSEHFAADEEAQAEDRREDLAAIGATARAYPRWLAIYCSAYADDAVHEGRIEWK